MHIPVPFVIIGLTLLGALSPILTLSTLWQIKEWRLDRLREHLKRERAFLQITGTLRPAGILLLGILELFDVLPNGIWIPVGLGFVALLNIVQIALHRQPIPTWTQKALSIVTVSLGGTFVLSVLSFHFLPDFLPLIPLLQPVVVFAAWVLLLPLDRILKRAVIERALLARNTHPEILVIGITGSVGKTTTKEVLAHLLAPRGAIATPAYMNAEIGLARWFTAQCSQSNPPPILIIEMGAYRKGEIALLAKMTQPSMGIITFIGKQHLGLFGSQQALIEAKGELLRALPPEGTAFLNGDSSLCVAMKDKCMCPVVIIGTGGHADLEAYEIEETATGIRFRLGEALVDVPIHGTHNVTNILLAIAAAERAGMKRAECIALLKTYKPLSHTFAVRKEHNVTLLDDTHNASSASFRAAIEWARLQPITPKILITPGLIELGEEHDRTHTDLGSLSTKVFDRVIFTQKAGMKPFAQGYGKPVELYTKHIIGIEPGALVVCAGRTPVSHIERLLPPA